VIIRYRHFEALYRRAIRYVAMGKIDEQALDDRFGGAFQIISRELLESNVQKVKTAIRHILASFIPRSLFPIWPFHPDLVLGENARAEYFHFRRWMKMKLKE
jgi:hypothetical protein